MNDLIDITELEQIIGHKFSDQKLLKTAITHPGLNKNISSTAFEKLEFLGDRVLGLSLCGFLYNRFSKETEGELAVRIATLAGTDFLISLAKKMKLIEYFRIPKDFYISCHKNSSAIADMMEAIFGAIFLDSNFESAQNAILNIYKNDIEKIIYKRKDSKTQLQEISQAQTKKIPIYRLLKVVGETHNPVFEIEVNACGKSAVGQGNSKRNAEHNAAENLLKIL
ncbi:MAG: ribonuclease III [Alphaproteobacteria bacterium]|nr:ribonuclease III [Alphaproteobacteria bacterium]